MKKMTDKQGYYHSTAADTTVKIMLCLAVGFQFEPVR